MSGKRAIAFAEWSMKGLLESSGGGEPYACREYMTEGQQAMSERMGVGNKKQGTMQGRFCCALSVGGSGHA